MTTRLLRWRLVEPPPRNAHKVLTTGDTGIEGLDGLVQLVYRGRLADGIGGWSVVAREERNATYDEWDGWYWTVLALTPEPSDYIELNGIPSEREARQIVADNWEVLERYARERLMAAATPEPPVAAQDAAEVERDRQAEEALGMVAPSMLSTVATVGAAAPPVTEARDARVSQDVCDALHERYFTEVSQVVGRLREIADRIERRTVGQSLRDLRLDYSAHAGEVMDDLRWGFGNTRLGPLARAARDADLAVRGRMP